MTFTLPDAAHPTWLALRVRDLDVQLSFYQDLLGIPVVEEDGPTALLSPQGGRFRLELHEDPQAPDRPRPSVGLYHFALLLPNRRFLAQLLDHLLNEGAPFSGFADHGVSEALYLTDPEGNGLELYRDREPSAWPRRGEEVAMVTRALDREDLLSVSQEASGMHPATKLGHVHLHVGDLEAAGAFYQRLGLAVTQSSYEGALFLAAGGYHHHVGLNAWAGNRQAPEGAVGMTDYGWEVPHGTVEALAPRLDRAERGQQGECRTVCVEDPAGVRVHFKDREREA